MQKGSMENTGTPVLTDGVEEAIRQGEDDDRKDSGSLTYREREILRLVAKRYRNNDIAKALGMAPAIIRHYKKTALEKLGIRPGPDVVRTLREYERSGNLVV